MRGAGRKAVTGSAKAPRAWQRMLSGRRLDLLDPSPLDIEIEDIAHGLARVARWNGQTQGPHVFSVAQHSLLVEAVAGAASPELPARDRMVVLLHDAPEYVIGDIISPFKAVLGDGYKGIERRLLAAIHLRFGLPATPRINDGRTPVLLHLLAPNHRVEQVTGDLASFWANTYPQVRKDLRGRYPRHSWPDDPLQAEPTACAKRRGT